MRASLRDCAPPSSLPPSLPPSLALAVIRRSEIVCRVGFVLIRPEFMTIAALLSTSTNKLVHFVNGAI